MNNKYKRVVNCAVIGTAVFAALAPFPRTFIERSYSMFLYPYFQRTMTRASNLTAVALFDIFVIAIIAMWWVALIRDVRREGGWKRAILRVLGRSIVWAGALYIAFVFLWGFNYRRVKLRDKLQVDLGTTSPERALSFAATAIDQLNATHDRAHGEQPNGFGSLDPELMGGFHRAQLELGSVIVTVPGRPKATLLSPMFRLAGIGGMTDPYFLEILMDERMLPVERPAAVAHEWGHLAGYADESEASFVGWLSCVHGSPADQYSGWLFAYLEIMSVISRADRAELVRGLAPGPIEDLRAIYERQERQISPRASHISRQVYDRYLKANRIPSGEANYGEVVGLLLGVQFGPDWTPKLKSKASP